MAYGGFHFVIGVPPVIIHFGLGFSRKSTNHFLGIPHDYGNPQITIFPLLTISPCMEYIIPFITSVTIYIYSIIIYIYTYTYSKPLSTLYSPYINHHYPYMYGNPHIPIHSFPKKRQPLAPRSTPLPTGPRLRFRGVSCGGSHGKNGRFRPQVVKHF